MNKYTKDTQFIEIKEPITYRTMDELSEYTHHTNYSQTYSHSQQSQSDTHHDSTRDYELDRESLISLGYLSNITCTASSSSCRGSVKSKKIPNEPITWLRMNGPGKKVKIRPYPNVTVEAIGMIRHNDEFAIVTNSPINGFLKLSENRGYINKNTVDVTWIDLEHEVDNIMSETIISSSLSPIKELPLLPEQVDQHLQQQQAEQVQEQQQYSQQHKIETDAPKDLLECMSSEGNYEASDKAEDLKITTATTTPSRTATTNKWLRLHCPDKKVKIRSGPSRHATTQTLLKSGDEIQVLPGTYNGYLKLVQQHDNVRYALSL